MKTFVLTFVLLSLLGCATPTTYQWGGYDALLYQSYKSPEKGVEVRQALEAHITKLEQSHQKVAPGLYAEVGTMYLQAGDSTKALVFYERERSAWPESKGLMDALIGNIGAHSNKTEIKS